MGEPTKTFALLPGSRAIDAGDDATCAMAPVRNLDQRGVARPQGAHCDIVAFEYQPSLTTPPPGGQPTAMPEMKDWGMMVFMLLAGLGSVRYLKRRERTED